MTYPIGTKLTSLEFKGVCYVVASDARLTYCTTNVNPTCRNIHSEFVWSTSKIPELFTIDYPKKAIKI